MKGKKAVAVAAAALMAATAVGAMAGCGSNKENTITILLLANDTEDTFYKNYFEQLENEFEEEGLSVDIKYNGYEESDYYTTLSDEIIKDNIPDIFYVRPNEILQYKDQIANLQEFATTQTDVDLSAIYESALNMYRFNPTTGVLGNASDDLYAFPKDLSTQQLGYNKTLLSQAEPEIHAMGLKMPYETGFEGYTWDEYKEVCKKVQAKIGNGKYASDIPALEILAKSFSSDKNMNTSPLIDLSNGRENGTIQSFDAGSPIRKAIEYQAALVAEGAANYLSATYSNFTAGKVAFYGLVGSWEVADYNEYLGDGNWGVMPWPTENKGDTWQGLITSAGYVVSKNCVEATKKDENGNVVKSQKGDIAKRIAISFMSSKTQNQLMKGQISLPLIKDWANDYKSPDNDSQYAPKSRGVYIDVISGEHGFFPAKYSTYNTDWLTPLTETDGKALESIWKSSNPVADVASTDWVAVRTNMQNRYNAVKNK